MNILEKNHNLVTTGEAGWTFVVGVDASLTSTGIALVAERNGTDPLLIRTHLVQGSTEDQDAHMAATQDAIDEVWSPYVERGTKWYGSCELVHFGKANPQVAIRLAYEHGNARGHLIRRFGRKSVGCYNPKSWRRHYGMASLERTQAKLAAINRVMRQWNVELDDDEAEAALIAQAKLIDLRLERQGTPLVNEWTTGKRHGLDPSALA